jgi:diguanylate cyclase (GGDEF)-like protein
MTQTKTLAQLIPGLSRKPRLMVVDDQTVMIRIMHEIFKEDFEVFMATSGKQALEMCLSQPPDIMLLDVMMPDMDGYEVCRTLKSSSQYGEFPVIFVTAQNDTVDEIRAFELGAVDFINKPIKPVLVEARVRAHVTVKLQSDLLRSYAISDGLTGVPNRRYFDEQMPIQWRQCMREQRPLSVMLIDIDFFKQYNDHYGHIAGDDAMKSVAKALSDVAKRPLDSLCRYGGEEFVCLLPATDLKGAELIAQRMVDAVRALALEHAQSQVEKILTVSIGISSVLPSNQSSAENLLAAADKQLYTSKDLGRNRVSSEMLS